MRVGLVCIGLSAVGCRLPADATDTGRIAIRYRGQIAADSEGRFTLTTLRPGWYLNGASYRPAHLHLKVWVDGKERLTTQLYLEDDPYNKDDPWFEAARALVMKKKGGVEETAMDVVV